MLEKLKTLSGEWKINCKNEPVDHGNFVDLGNYVIDLGTFGAAEYMEGIRSVNGKIDTLARPMCTAVVKRNKKGEVIVGRNQDLEVSNYPAYISHLEGGKYKAVAFNYNNKGEITYEQLRQGAELPANLRCMLAASSCDAFNEKGLYIQCNMRWGGDHPSSGSNPGGIRVAMGAAAGIVAQNAATVMEAVEFFKTLDIYTAGATKDGTARGGWDGGYLVGDAEGNYGVIEVANNLVYFTPYANGHCNAFVNPILQATDRFASGYGRLHMGQQSMIGAETAKEMMEAIHKADWRREVEDLELAYVDQNGNPHFVDKDGNPSVDFRCEATMTFPVDDEGNLTEEPVLALAELAQQLGWCADRGVLPDALFLDADKAPGLEWIAKLKEDIEQYVTELSKRYHENCTREWLMDNKNFETVRACYRKFFGNGEWAELVRRFKAGDEKGIRDKGDVFTTGMNFGVNCAEKYLMVRFMENEDCIYEYRW